MWRKSTMNSGINIQLNMAECLNRKLRIGSNEVVVKYNIENPYQSLIELSDNY